MAKATPIEGAQELQTMLVSYAKQETIEPLKALATYLAKGLAGAMLLFVGAMFLGVGTLRLVQSETDVFAGQGKGSIVPYLAALAVLLILIGLIYLLFLRAKKRVQP